MRPTQTDNQAGMYLLEASEGLSRIIEQLRGNITPPDSIETLNHAIVSGLRILRHTEIKQSLLLKKLGKLSQEQTVRRRLQLSQLRSLIINPGKKINDHSIQALDAGQVAVSGLDKIVTAITDSNRKHKEAMNFLNQLSHCVEQIVLAVDNVDDIAEQTNLLALNASIEASRAGQSGQGFVVVADEVRKQAAQAATATRAITSLLQQLQLHADNALQSLSDSQNKIANASISSTELTDNLSRSLKHSKEVCKEAESLHNATNLLVAELARMDTHAKEQIQVSDSLSRQHNDNVGIIEAMTNSAQQSQKRIDQATIELANQLIEVRHIERMLQTSQTIIRKVAS